MLALLLRQPGMRFLLVARGALRRDQRPADGIRRTDPRLPIGRGDFIDEVVVNSVGDPDLLEMRGHTVTRERETHEVEEALLLRTALDPAAPVRRRAQRIAAQRVDLAPVAFAEVVAAHRRARRAGVFPFRM